MRIHFIIATLLCGLTVAIVWWNGVKSKDFITPPNAEAILVAQRKARESLQIHDAIIPDEPTKAILVKATKLNLPDPKLEAAEIGTINTASVTDVGDLLSAPGLDSYASFAEKGTTHLIALATLLETKGELQRALLVWERVVDMASTDDRQYDTAIKAIQRLTPMVPNWNIDSTSTVVIMLDAGCDRDTAKILRPILEEAASILTASSSGILKVEAKIHERPSPAKDSAKLPIAIWFSGVAVNSAQSATVSIPSVYADPAQMRSTLLFSIYKLIREDIDAKTAFTPPRDASSGQDPTALFPVAITRLAWQEFATNLNIVKP